MKYRFGSVDTSLGPIVIELDDQGTAGVTNRGEKALEKLMLNYDSGSLLGVYELGDIDVEFNDDREEIYNLLLTTSGLEDILFNLLDYSLNQLYEFRVVACSIWHDPVRKVTGFTAIDRLTSEMKTYKVGELSPTSETLLEILADIFGYFSRTLNVGTYPTYTGSSTFTIYDIKFIGTSLSAVRSLRVSEFINLVAQGFGSKLFQKNGQWYFQRLEVFGQSNVVTFLRGAKIYKMNPEYHKEIYASWDPGDTNYVNPRLYPGKISEIDCFETIKIYDDLNEDVSSVVLQWHLDHDYKNIYCREDLEYIEGECIGFVTPDEMIYDGTLQRYYYPLRLENDLIKQTCRISAVEAAL